MAEFVHENAHTHKDITVELVADEIGTETGAADVVAGIGDVVLMGPDGVFTASRSLALSGIENTNQRHILLRRMDIGSKVHTLVLCQSDGFLHHFTGVFVNA